MRNKISLYVFGLNGLTKRQKEIAHLASEGWSNEQIALHLGISSETIRSHMRWVYEKTDLQRTTLWKLFHNPETQNMKVN